MKVLIPFLLSLLFLFSSCQEKIDHSESSDVFEVKKYTGAEQFALLHKELRESPPNSKYQYESGYLTTAFQKARKQKKFRSQNLDWIERGPGNVSGRTRAIWIHPNNPMTWYLGSAQGGVWQTTDGGQSYQNLTPDLPHLSTAAIMGCRSNPNVIYAGSGEGFNVLQDGGGGIFKTTDGGQTWQTLPSTLDNAAFSNIYRLAVNPTNPDIVYAATKPNNSLDVEGFVMKSVDGGLNWTEVLRHYDIIPHLLIKPDEPETLFATLNQEGVLKSTNGGADWEYVFLNEVDRPGRIEMAISDLDPNMVYFTTPQMNRDRVYVSENGGQTFNEVDYKTSNDNFGRFSGGQSFWNKAIAVHPFDPLTVFVGGQSAILELNIEKTSDSTYVADMDVVCDGYGSYTDQGYFPGTKGVHVDHHGIAFSVTDSTLQEYIMINTNDGGVAVSYDKLATFIQTGDTFLQGFNPENGNWTTLDGFNVSTFYGVDKMNGSDRYVGGTQDNGSWVSPEDPDQAANWIYAPSGDGFEAAWNYNDGNLILESSQFNNIYKSSDGGNEWTRLDIPGSGPFVTAIANSKQDGNFVMVSTNEGPAWSTDFGDSWTLSQVPDQYDFDFRMTPIKISLATPDVVWTGSRMQEDNRICVSTDGGRSFDAVGLYDKEEMGRVSGIATHPLSKETAYVLFSASGLPKVLKTNDMGDTWEDLSGFENNGGKSSNGFPNVAVHSLLVMPFDTNTIWVGTEIGIVESKDGGISWEIADNGLPSVAVWELKVINDEVVVATHGRGIWSVSLPELEGYEPIEPPILSSLMKLNSFGNRIFGDIQQRVTIDSGEINIYVDIDGTMQSQSISLSSMESNENYFLDTRLLDLDLGHIIREAIVETTVYKNGLSATSSQRLPIYELDDDLAVNYNNSFDEGVADFVFSDQQAVIGDFSYQKPDGFISNGMLSVSPYGNGAAYYGIFQKPIRVSDTTHLVLFNEIALIEPGASLDPFNPSFYDYVEIEATIDGSEWFTLDRYDATDDDNWLSLYEMFVDPTDSDYVKRSIDLRSYFEDGDLVYIRFHLYSDGFVNGWGWIIDDFAIEGSIISSTETIEDDIYVKTRNNPFQDYCQIDVVGIGDIVNYYLVDEVGREYQNAIQLEKGVNKKTLVIDGDKMQSGIYFAVIVANGKRYVEKIIKL